ncbi:sporulation integral membrane protein YtvI [Bacillus sp. HMF5848]|uniref:sporulation integral membrane protein YtvI n=1 Tax=Bacillus sp. HMF5848 TaxID=2495421 RepID=UPI0021AD730F|nr:sporulation integral membrane protein YtvI [Bacillus sp. HMF5848]
MKKRILLWGVVIFIFLFMIRYGLPIVFALLTALMLEGSVKKLHQKFKFSRGAAVTTVFLTFLLVLATLGYLIVAIIVDQLLNFSLRFPFVISDITSIINSFIHKWELYADAIPVGVIESLEDSFESTMDSLIESVTAIAQSVVLWAAKLPEFLIHILVYLIGLYMISFELPNIKAKAAKALSESTSNKFKLVYAQLNKAGIGFLKAQLILSVVTYVLSLIGLLILNVPYAAVISIFVVLVDLLPILGTGSFLVPWALFVLIKGNTLLAVGLVILFLVITVVRRVIEPKIFSTNMGIDPLAALISMYLGFQLIGFLGLFAGPTVVILYEALKKANIVKFSVKL